MRYPLRLLLLVLLLTLPAAGKEPVGAAQPVSSACTGAGVTLNAVVRFYLALDQRDYAAAYACLDPALQRATDIAAFEAPYSGAAAVHLIMARPLTSDTVAFELRMLGSARGVRAESTYDGTWRVTSTGQLADPSPLQLFKTYPAQRPAPLNFYSILTRAGLATTWHLRRDVTGNRIADDIYVAADERCSPVCHSPEVLVYEQGRLIFAESSENVDNIHRSQGHMSIRRSGHLYRNGLQTWQVQPYGFTLQEPCVIPRSSDPRYNSLGIADQADIPHRWQVDTTFLSGPSDLAKSGTFSGMDAAFAGLGYLGGCVEDFALPGRPASSMTVQTDLFADQGGGAAAYFWEQGLYPWVKGAPVDRLPLTPLDATQTADAACFIDAGGATASEHGAWLVARFRQGEVLETVLLYSAGTDAQSCLHLEDDFEYDAPLLFAHLRLLAFDGPAGTIPASLPAAVATSTDSTATAAVAGSPTTTFTPTP